MGLHRTGAVALVWLIMGATCAVAAPAPSASFGESAARLTGVQILQVRVLGTDGIELPREAAKLFRYALALVPGALFGIADRSTLRQINPDDRGMVLDADALAQWAAQGAKPWQPATAALAVAPATVRVARVMTAAFSPQGDSRLGVGFRDLATDSNLILVYVDAPCVVSGSTGPPAQPVLVNLHFAAAGLYWLRTIAGQPIVAFAPRTVALDVRARGQESLRQIPGVRLP